MTVQFDIESDIKSASQGDSAAFGRLVRAHEKMLLAFAAYRLPVYEEACEAVQDTFIRAYAQLADFRAGADFGVWLRSICRFMILSRVNEYTRRRRKHDSYREQLAVLAVQTINANPQFDYAPDPYDRLSECTEQLSGQHRALIADRYHRSLTIQQISDKTGRTNTWVTSTLHRVRSALRTCLEKHLKESSHEQ
jgi:RNA polymerase sigma-70 factor, ECF subfamily